MSKNIKRKRSNYLIVILLFIIEAVVFASVMLYVKALAVLPIKLFNIIAYSMLALVAVELILLIASFKRKPSGVAKLINTLCIVTSVLVIGAGVGLKLIYNELSNITDNDEKFTVMTVYAVKGSGINNLGDIDGKTIGVRGIIDIENTAAAVEKMKGVVGHVSTEEYIDFKDQVQALYDNKVAAILINEAYKGIITADFSDFSDRTEAIYRVKLKKDPTAQLEKAKVTSEPFYVYVSGIDTRGEEIIDESTTDVNIVLAINPVTKKITMISIPRDFYVGLDGDSNKMDKLTHAGIYGIDCSMRTIESLLDIKFNYYAKVNFLSVVQIVDALGGITVYSDYDFSSYAGIKEDQTYYFKVGENTLNGDQALAFSRERESFTTGDRQRGINQEKVIKAIIEKATSPAIITNIGGVLTAVTQNVKTNMEISEINALIQMQLTEMSSWKVEMTSVNGNDAHEVTYSGGSQPLYVMKPDYSTIDAAKQKLAETMALPENNTSK